MVDAAAALAQAEHLLRVGRFEETDDLCRSLLKTFPRAAEAHRFLGLSAFSRDRLSEAEAHVRRALALAPNSAAAHDNLSLYLLRQGRAVEAEAAARQALRLQPDLAAAAHNLGLALRNQGRIREAEACMRQALVLEPRNADLWNNLATVMEQQRRPTEAIVALELAVRMRPDFALAQENLERLRAVPLPAPQDAGLRAAAENNRGVQLLAQKHYEAAEQAFRQAMLLAPELAEISFNLAKSLQAQQQFEQAEEHFLRAVRQRPDWPEAHFHLAYLYYCQRRLSDAEAEYRAPLSWHPPMLRPSTAWPPTCSTIRAGSTRPAMPMTGPCHSPGHASCHSNMLLNEQYNPKTTLAGLAESHAHGSAAMPSRCARAGGRTPRAKTRIGRCVWVLSRPISSTIPSAFFCLRSSNGSTANNGRRSAMPTSRKMTP